MSLTKHMTFSTNAPLWRSKNGHQNWQNAVVDLSHIGSDFKVIWQRLKFLKSSGKILKSLTLPYGHHSVEKYANSSAPWSFTDRVRSEIKITKRKRLVCFGMYGTLQDLGR